MHRLVGVRLSEAWNLSLGQVEALLVIGGIVTAAAIRSMRVLYRAGKTYESVAGAGGVVDQVSDLKDQLNEQKVQTRLILQQHRDIIEQQQQITHSLTKLSEQFAEVFETHTEVRGRHHE